MKKYIPYVIVFLIFIILLVYFSLQKPKVIGNADLINEITHIEQLSVIDEERNNNLTVRDLQNLEALTKGDEIAEDYVEELKWIVEHNESQHLLHETLYMREYIKTGVDVPCIPHELWHVFIFVKHGDIDYAKKQLKYIEKNYDAWVKSVEEKRKDYPHFYNGSEELEQMSRESIENLKQNNYSNRTLEQLGLMGAAALC